MPYTDLLRLTVLLTAGEATALATVTVLAVQRQEDTLTLLIGAGWWTAAILIGLVLGTPRRAADGVREALANARTATALPQESDTGIALRRLWPIGATALAAGVLGIFFPGVAMVGGGYAILVALAWRTREAAVLGIEERDGVRFYVEPGSALKPVDLIRTPGLTRDRAPAGHPPPPSSA